MPISNKFQKTLGKDDFFTTDINVPSQTWTTIGEYTVPAQQEIAVGATEIVQGGATGFSAYMRFDDTGGGQLKANCRIRVNVVDANDQGQVVAEYSAAQWSSSATLSRTTSLLLHEDFRRVVEDSKIQVQIFAKQDEDGVLIASMVGGVAVIDYSDSDTDIVLPITVYTVRR